MSRGNILEISGGLTGCVVTFACRDGSVRRYAYTGSDAAAIMGGMDPPRDFRGQLTDDSESNITQDDLLDRRRCWRTFE